MSALSKPGASVSGTAVDPLGPAGVIIDPETELAGAPALDEVIKGDGLGGWVIGSAPSPTDIGGRTIGAIASLAVDDQGTYALGRLIDYTGAQGSPQAAFEVQYTRVWLVAGTDLVTMRTFITGGANGARRIRMGVYDQADPTDPTDVPQNLVADTGNNTPPAAFTGKRDVTLSALYTVPASGWYWLALQVESGALVFLLSDTWRADSAPRREENPGSLGLPAGAGATTSPQSAALYCAAME